MLCICLKYSAVIVKIVLYCNILIKKKRQEDTDGETLSHVKIYLNTICFMHEAD